MITLRPRLAALAARVPQGARVADIGTDHARLPLWLLQRNVTQSVIAADIADGPLARARALADRVDLSDALVLVKSDGLKALSEDDIDTVVVAGMGGETIADILQTTPWSHGKHLLLQPMSRPERLLAYLHGAGLDVSEHCVEDNGRRYCIFECNRGNAQ